MACQQQVGGAGPTGRSSGGADGHDDVRTHRGSAEDHFVPPAAPDDFEFCILSNGGLAPAAGDDAADMCVADEVFSGGKLLPLRRLSSAASADASALLRLLRSDSLDGAATASTTTGSSSGFSSRSVSRSSSSCCVSRSTSSNSASSSSDHAGPTSGSSSSSSSSKSASSSSADAAAAVPLRPRRSLSGSVFYAHPSPSPRPPPRRTRTSTPAARRSSTGSAPPASWGVIRLGVVGAPEVYAPRPAEYRKAAAASSSGSRSARFEQHRTAADKKLALGLLGAGLVCSCSPDAVAPVGSAEVAAAAARRRRKKAEQKKRSSSATPERSGKGTARRSRILEWLEDLSISKEKSAASSCR